MGGISVKRGTGTNAAIEEKRPSRLEERVL